MFLTSAPPLASIYHGHYSLVLVTVSLFIAVFATFFSLLISSGVRKVSSSGVRYSLLLLSSITMGVGIWTMHFVGMLAFKLDCQVSYDGSLTLLSILPAICAAFVANDLLTRKDIAPSGMLLGAIFIGFGIAAMHHIGMRSMRIEGLIEYDFSILALSVFFAVFLAYIALRIADKIGLPDLKSRLLVSVIFGFAISGMHYMAMFSTYFVKGPAAVGITDGISYDNLSFIVAGLFIFNIILATLTYLIAYYRTSQSHQISEEEFHDLIDTIEDYAIIKLDATGVIRTWNKGAERIKGYKAEEIVGKHFSIFYQEIDVVSGRFTRILDWAKTTGRFEEEGVRVKKGGILFYASVVIRPMFSATGNLEGFSKVTRDISERKLTEANLKEKQQLIVSVTNAMNEGMYALDKHGLLVFMNPEAERVLGWSQDELMGRPIHEIIHSARSDRADVNQDDIIMKTIKHGHAYSASDVIFTTKYGVRLPVSLYSSPRKNADEIIGAVVVFRDISREIQAQNVLRDQAQRLRQLLENSPISIRIKSRTTHKIIFANHSYAQMFGMDKEGIIGKDPMLYYKNPQDYIDVNVRLDKGDVIKNYLVELKTDIDDSLWVLATYMNIEYEGEAASIGWFYDVTELRHSRQLAEDAVKVKSDFLSTMSHEIRTPMNGVVGMVDLLSDTALDDEQQEYVSVIKDSADALLEIINDILDFSKIEAGMLHILAKEFSIRNLVEGCVDLLANKAFQKQLTFTYFISPAFPEKLIGDAGRIRQVLLNLMGNAIKFTEKGHIHVNVIETGKQDDLYGIDFEVTDSGIGIAQDKLDSLFKPFSQADGSVSRKYGGTGLGLSICKRLAEAMKGSIHVSSELGRGSTFTFTLQLQTMPEEEPAFVYNPVKGREFLLLAPPSALRDVLALYIHSWDGKVISHETPSSIMQAVGSSQCSLMLMLMSDAWDARSVIHQVMNHNHHLKLLLIGEQEQLDKVDDVNIYKMKLAPLKQSALFNTILSILDRRKTQVGVPTDRRSAVQEDTGNEGVIQGKVLLVDDNYFNKKVAISQLKKLGYSAVTVSNGLEALEKYKSMHFDLILMDCHMPMMDGYEATAHIRKIEEETNMHIPIVAMTADAMLGGREICLQAGMDDYLAKPIDINELKKILDKWISQILNTQEWNNLQAKSEPELQKLLDMERLRSIFGNDLRIKQVVNEFSVWMKPMLDDLDTAIRNNDFATVKSIAHQIKGVVLNLGMSSMGEISSEMETDALAENAENLDKLFSQLKKSHLKIEILFNLHI